MKNFNFFEKLWEHGRTLRRVGLVLVMCLTIGVGQAWADETLVDINFSSWSDQTICGDAAQQTVNGYTFLTKKSGSEYKSFSITSGVMTWCENNMATDGYYIGIPVTGINNGTITISAYNGSSKASIKYVIKDGATSFSTALGGSVSSEVKSASNGAAASVTISTLTNANKSAYVYIGRGSTSLTTCTRIVISTPAAASTWYVKGGWNSWGTTDNLKGSGTELSATVNITTAGLYEFKIWNSDGNTWYGNTGNIGCNVSGWTFSTGESANCKFFASETGNYTFTFNTSTKALSVTYPTAQGKYYYKNTSSWGTVAVYRYVGGINNDWPGTQVVETETICGDTYYFTYADPGTTIIFNNNGGGSQTGNMAASGNAGKYVSGTGSSWTAFTYNVTYDKNGGTGSVPTDATNYTSGTSVSVKDNTGGLAKSGYYFAGWNTKADGSGTTYMFGETFSITSCTTLYAKWTAVTCPDGSEEGTVFSLTSPTETVSVPASSSATITSSQATVSKGLATMVNGQSSAKNLINSSKFNFPNGNTVLRLNLGCALAKGDVISFTGANYKLMVSKTNSTSPGTDNYVTQPSKTENCTIPAGSNLIGLKEVYIVRAEGSTTTCTAITITRPAGCTAPTVLAASSVTAKGATLTVTDEAEDGDDYEFYVSTSSTAPTAGSSATHTATGSKSITITSCVANTTYYAWARTKCSSSNKSDWVALTGNTFTTSTVTVTHTLTNVDKTSGETTAGGSAYEAVYAAASGYSLPTPTVTIDGNTATSGTDYTWTAGTGTISIPAAKITGNIVITLNSVPSAPSSATISGAYHYFPGDNISLTCTPSGNNGPTTYQWYKGGKADGNAIEGATTATYTKNSCTFDDAGSYYCKVTCNATSIWANSGNSYDVKILRLYVNGSKSGDPYGNVDFVKVSSTTATASISLGSNWTYGFNIADGCGHYYGNSGTMKENNCTNWVTNVNGTDCGLTTTNAATYVFTINYSNLSMITTSITYPSANQAADKVIYFDNNVLKWTGSSIYYRIGHSSHSQADQLSLVPGTANLYKMTTREYNGFSAWQIGNAEGGNGSSKSIYNTQNTPAITASIAYEGGAVTADAVTVTPGSDHSTGGDAQNNNCEFYSKTITTGMKTDRVTISDYSNGTITVNYTNTSNVASTLTSGYADLAHTVILTSITAVADEGYDASAITINGGAYSTNYVVTGNTTIAASFTLKTYTISYNKGTNGTGSKDSETKTHGVNFTLPGSTFTYGGHAQDGWSTSDGGALAYALSGSYTTNAAQEFFPHWKCNTPSITDNGDNTVSITVPSGTTVRYTTDGTDPSSSTGTVYSTTFSIAADCTVKAIAYQSNCTDSEIASQDCDYTAPANFQMIATTSGSDATLTHNEFISASSKNCAILTGGTAKYVDEDASQKMTVKSGESYGWNFNRNKDQIVITLSGHVLQEGSVITVSGYANADLAGFKMNGVTIFSKTSGSGSFADQSYTVLSTDEALINKNVLTLTRNSGSGAYLHSITISNCLAATPCTTPTLPSLSNQAGCSYSAWNATPSNASTISAAGESILYSWKKGATEKATTASYTPNANGTDYTVTVTVSKAGKISTSVTSSALTATKYAATSISTQPTTAVAAIIDEDFTLGSTLAATGQGTLNYQWFSYSNPAGDADETSVRAASTTKTYTTSKASAGTYYYRVKVIGDCGTVASNVITVTVSEPPCFSATNLVKNGDWSDVAVDGFIDAAKVVGTITGGTIKNTGSATLGSNSKSENAGLVMEGSSKQVTVTLSGSNHLTVGSVITLTAAVSDGAKSGTSKTSGLVVSGYDCSPVNKASETAYDSFTQSYTVTEESSLVEANSFTIALKSGLDKTYLHAITVTGCEECEMISPTLTAGTTTLYTYPEATSTTLTLDKDGSSGTVTWTSSDPSIASVSGSGTSATVTAVGTGSATITASIAADGTHCAKSVTKTFTVTGSCGYNVIASAVLTSKTAATTSGCTLLASNMSNSSAPYKLDKTLPSYFGLQLSSGSFQVGDSIIFKVKIGDMDINDGTTYPVAVFTSTSTDDKATAIYTSGANTKGSDNVYIRFVVTSGMLTALNTNKQVLIIRNTNIKQNHSMYFAQVKRYVCPEGVFEFNDASSDGKWSTAGNWVDDGGVAESLPTISDRVIISKPVTVDDDDAVASEVILDQKSPNTGKLTIDAGNALIIAGTLKKTTTGTSVVATAAADVVINSTRAAGTGALIIGSHDGTNAATVNFETKVKYDNGYVNQYLGSPFSDETPYVDYEIQLYKFVPQGNGSHGWWNKLSYGDEMVPFMGYNQLSNNTSGNYLNLNGRTGHLNASSNVEFTTANGKMYYNSSWPENMFANSWTAPIHIDQFEDGDFTNVKKVIYIFNAGTPAQYNEAYGGENSLGNDSGDEDNEAAGTYTVIPVKSAAELSALGAITTVIPAMQAFSVMATSSSPSLTLNFNRLVYTPATTDLKIEPTRAPKRNEERPDAMRLRVRGENGWTTNAYILGREDFTNGYDDGWDGEYMEGDGSAPQLYSATEEGYFVVNCVPEIEGTLMAFHPGSADNAYTFSFVYNGSETWYLNDMKEQTSTLISNETNYPFVSVAGDNPARFVISKTPYTTTEIATGVTNLDDVTLDVQKVIYNDKLYIIRGGKVFSADGQLVK